MKNIPKVFIILVSGLSAFKLVSALLNHDISFVFKKILEKYDKLLEPINFFFGPLFERISNILNFELPEYWTHVFIIWILIGSITLRAAKFIDKKEGTVDTASIFEKFLGEAFMVFLGAISLISMSFFWIRHEIFFSTTKAEENYSPFSVLFKETVMTLLAMTVYFVIDAFV